MLTDSLLHLLDTTVELSLAQVFAALVGNRVEGYQLRMVVMIAVLLLQTSLYESLRTVEIGVIAGIERVPPSIGCCILLGRASHHCHHENQQYDDGSLRMTFLFLFPSDVFLQVSQLAFSPATARTAVALLLNNRLIRATA